MALRRNVELGLQRQQVLQQRTTVLADIAEGQIEVKASATVKAGDFSGLRVLAEACGDRFAFGVVLYDSTDVVPFGDRLAAAPLSCLWG